MSHLLGPGRQRAEQGCEPGILGTWPLSGDCSLCPPSSVCALGEATPENRPLAPGWLACTGLAVCVTEALGPTGTPDPA